MSGQPVMDPYSGQMFAPVQHPFFLGGGRGNMGHAVDNKGVGKRHALEWRQRNGPYRKATPQDGQPSYPPGQWGRGQQRGGKGRKGTGPPALTVQEQERQYGKQLENQLKQEKARSANLANTLSQVRKNHEQQQGQEEGAPGDKPPAKAEAAPPAPWYCHYCGAEHSLSPGKKPC